MVQEAVGVALVAAGGIAAVATLKDAGVAEEKLGTGDVARVAVGALASAGVAGIATRAAQAVDRAAEPAGVVGSITQNARWCQARHDGGQDPEHCHVVTTWVKEHETDPFRFKRVCNRPLRRRAARDFAATAWSPRQTRWHCKVKPWFQ